MNRRNASLAGAQSQIRALLDRLAVVRDADSHDRLIEELRQSIGAVREARRRLYELGIERGELSGDSEQTAGG